MQSFGAFPVRRAKSDRDAVRMMRQIVRDGNALGMFTEGRGSAKVCQARFSWCRDGRDQRVRPADGDPREPHLADRELAPVSVAWGEPMTFEAPREGKGYKEASLEVERKLHESSGSGSSSSTRSAARASATPR